jgi:protein O-GlcNAc transferase
MPSKDILLRSKFKLGKKLIEAKRLEEARLVYQQICARRKNDVDSWFTLGTINGMLKRHDEAVTCCSRAVELAPQHGAAWYNLGIAFRDTGQTEKAAAALRRTLLLNPKHEGAATSLGHILVALHRYEEAEEVFRGVLDYQDCNAEFYAVYGSAMQTMGRYEAAINAYHKAIKMRHPRTVEIYENMAAALCMQGKYRESINTYDTALRFEPDNTRTYSSYLLTQHYLIGQDAGTILDRHRHWPGNALYTAPLPVRAPPAARPDRLRIGYVSSDFRKHSVAYFIAPLLANHDDERFKITCYFSHKDADATTESLQRLVHHWNNITDLNDQQLQQMIADDGIDILVDLNGHTSGNRLTVFARRAAPVQVSFIGYPDTTGVMAMDYRLSDAIADPPGAERLCTESLYRLPGCFLCYRPPENAPDVSPPPAEKNRYITFGSFNNLAKVNAEVIDLWARLLRGVPASRLIIKNPSLTDKSTRERYQALFVNAGVSVECVDLLGFVSDDAGHLGTYNQIDIALDTFPYNGTTTTCEALWMGVPVVSLRGDRHSARVGASLLSAAGYIGWVADTPEQYIQIAHSLAQNTSHLVQLRSGLREQIRESDLCAAQTYARAVEDAYDEMQRKARQLAPEQS